ncbi:hypothetical protein [Pseudogulbenkiania sp. NH8B]|nr:hypothetical protein [Pseudogulbenkiania sp. NH8B]
MDIIEIIIGDISEEAATRFRERGMRLRFIDFKHGQARHIARKVVA